MAKQYVITEAEMNSLFDQLQMQEMGNKNILIRPDEYSRLSPEEQNRLNSVHRAFHMVCVRWAQEMGFKGGRF